MSRVFFFFFACGCPVVSASFIKYIIFVPQCYLYFVKEQLTMFWGFPGGSDVKESTCKAGYLGSVPGLEDPLEKGMATHSVFLPGVAPWTEAPHGLQSMGSQRVRRSWATKHSTAQEALLLDSPLCSTDLSVLFFHQHHTVLITVSLLSIILKPNL